MKKIIIPLLMSISILLFFLLVVKFNNINAESVEILANNKIGTSLEIDVEDQDLIEEISTITTAKRYFKQPLYESYSRNEVDFEIKIFNLNDNNKIVNTYRILLNTDDGGGIGNRSRIDVLKRGREYDSEWRSFTVFLTKEQVEELTKCIQKYLP